MQTQPPVPLPAESADDGPQRRRLPPDERRRPDTVPTFPIDADAPVDLLVCLMTSLYGLREARAMAMEFNKRLDDRFRLMRSCPSPLDNEAESRPQV